MSNQLSTINYQPDQDFPSEIARVQHQSLGNAEGHPILNASGQIVMTVS